MLISILIVDDEAIVRESIRDWLQEEGYQVEVAENGEEALTLVDRRDYHVIIVDLRLPGMNGLEVLKLVKAKRPAIKSIIITAYPTDLSREQARDLGPLDYLVKPIFPADLEKLIQDAVADLEKKP
jgi:heterodisulfide reductase subunit A2